MYIPYMCVYRVTDGTLWKKVCARIIKKKRKTEVRCYSIVYYIHIFINI